MLGLSLRRSAALALLATFVAPSCGGAPRPAWVELAMAIGSSRTRVLDESHALPDGGTARIVSEQGTVRLEVALRRADWQESELPNFWLAHLALDLSGGMQVSPAGFELRSGKRLFPPAPRWGSATHVEGGFPANHFQVDWRGIVLHCESGREPPEHMTLSAALQCEGNRAHRVLGRRFSGRGFQVWPGQERSLTVDVPAGSALRFATTVGPLLRGPWPEAPPTEFEVLQDGEKVFEHTVSDPLTASYSWHEVALPRTGVRSEFTFRVSGTLALTSFMTPVLGPAVIGGPGERPWKESRPDVMLFVADTFRADNMGSYGGSLELTPNLDRFAAENRLYRRAWSAGTFTLPSHVSMFSGLLPYQAGLSTIANALPDDIETIAERLSAAGYRTGAVTDSGIVSRRFAFDQGFAYFDEKKIDLDSTFDRAMDLIDADDGRPLFLFVHTYRAHSPYEISPETRAALGEGLGIDGEYLVLEQRLRRIAEEKDIRIVGDIFPEPLIETEEAGKVVSEMRAQYLGGVVDLDRGFGRFLGQLASRDWLAHGDLLLTSDHGEAFGEHGQFQHGGPVFESETRIPLVLAGRDVPPGAVDASASHVDLAPTIAALADVPPQPGWVGRSLLAPGDDRPVLSFELSKRGTFALIEGSRKVIGVQEEGAVESGTVVGAFDLDQDPTELRNRTEDGESWPAEMLRRLRPNVDSGLVPVVESRGTELDSADIEELGKLGYGNN